MGLLGSADRAYYMSDVYLWDISLATTMPATRVYKPQHP